MPIYHHLSHALSVMAREPNYRKWAPLIEALPESAREECRTWLRQEARKRQLRDRATQK